MNNIRLHRQSGATLIMMVGMVLVIVALGVFAVDVGYIFVAKNRLQNAVDAAAQAGATTIYRATGFTFASFPDGLYPNRDVGLPGYTNSGTQTYKDMADQEARTSLRLSGLTSSEVSSALVVTNWWNTINTSARYHNPAVKVTVSSQVDLIFSRLFNLGGFTNATLTASALAVAPFPSGIRETVPMAVSNCAYNYGWDLVNQKPKEFAAGTAINPGSYYVIKSGSATDLAALKTAWGLVPGSCNPNNGNNCLTDYNTNTFITPTTPLVIGSTFKVPSTVSPAQVPAGSSVVLNSGFYASSNAVPNNTTSTGCTSSGGTTVYTGLWSNMTSDASYGTGASAISDRIIGTATYKPVDVNRYGQIRVASGNQSSNFGYVEDCRVNGKCFRATLPVLSDITSTDATGSALKTVNDFTCIYILKSTQSTQEIVGKFANGCNNSAISNPTDKYLGSMTTPLLGE